MDVVVVPLLIISVIAGLVISARLNGGGLRVLINLWIVTARSQRCGLNGTASILLIVTWAVDIVEVRIGVVRNCFGSCARRLVVGICCILVRRARSIRGRGWCVVPLRVLILVVVLLRSDGR